MESVVNGDSPFEPNRLLEGRTGIERLLRDLAARGESIPDQAFLQAVAEIGKVAHGFLDRHYPLSATAMTPVKNDRQAFAGMRITPVDEAVYAILRSHGETTPISIPALTASPLLADVREKDRARVVRRSLAKFKKAGVVELAAAPEKECFYSLPFTVGSENLPVHTRQLFDDDLALYRQGIARQEGAQWDALHYLRVFFRREVVGRIEVPAPAHQVSILRLLAAALPNQKMLFVAYRNAFLGRAVQALNSDGHEVRVASSAAPDDGSLLTIANSAVFTAAAHGPSSAIDRTSYRLVVVCDLHSTIGEVTFAALEKFQNALHIGLLSTRQAFRRERTIGKFPHLIHAVSEEEAGQLKL